MGKAAGGLLLLGPVGLLGGLIGSKQVMVTCLKCGNKWEAGSAQAQPPSKTQDNIGTQFNKIKFDHLDPTNVIPEGWNSINDYIN